MAFAPARAAEITPAALDRLPPAEIYLLGEVHDNPAHHEHQARAVAALAPSALVFEMLTPEQAARVTPETRADADTLAEVLEWEASGWPDFAMYFPIFEAAPEAAIFGAALPRAAARAAMELPPEEAFGTDAARFGLDRPLPEAEQQDREALQASAHCDMLPDTMLPAMVAIQRLRDAMLARAALDSLAATGGPVAVITGTGHVRTDQGVPLKLARAAPGVAVLALGQLEAAPDAAPPFDLWIVTDPVDRPDPCDAFR
ncbi:MAG: ChaN family lipoprotein [Rhodobacteraceae bacterium]|nr:ChaN family lipoprotein [Paracoccaceae bacterium]